MNGSEDTGTPEEAGSAGTRGPDGGTGATPVDSAAVLITTAALEDLNSAHIEPPCHVDTDVPAGFAMLISVLVLAFVAAPVMLVLDLLS